MVWIVISLGYLVTPLARGESSYVPMPKKEVFRDIQQQAYICSRNNKVKDCKRTRLLADPLMDHPRLPYACKDAIWELITMAKRANENSFKRRDSIDIPARKLSIVCKSQPKKRNPSMLKRMPKESTQT